VVRVAKSTLRKPPQPNSVEQSMHRDIKRNSGHTARPFGSWLRST